MTCRPLDTCHVLIGAKSIQATETSFWRKHRSVLKFLKCQRLSHAQSHEKSVRGGWMDSGQCLIECICSQHFLQPSPLATLCETSYCTSTISSSFQTRNIEQDVFSAHMACVVGHSCMNGFGCVLCACTDGSMFCILFCSDTRANGPN